MKKAAYVLGLVVVFTGLSATAAFAAETPTVQTRPLAISGNSTCPALFAGEVTPYIYEGSLDSFDITVSDASYVAIGATVGDTAIPFNYLTRRVDANGHLRIHGDLQSTPVGGSLPITVTLISAAPGAPVCVSTVSFTVQGTGTATSGSNTGTGTGSGASVGSGTSGSVVSTTVSGSGTKTPSSTIVTPVTSTPDKNQAGTVGSALTRICAQSGAKQLWLVLLALYALIVAFAAIAQESLMRRSTALPVALIVGPLVLLVGFWYFAEACRAANWIPIILLIAAVAGLLAAFRQETGDTRIIELPEAKNETGNQ